MFYVFLLSKGLTIQSYIIYLFMYVTLSNKVFMRLFLILEDIPKEYTLSSCSLNH
jgi:hypothetical protein